MSEDTREPRDRVDVVGRHSGLVLRTALISFLTLMSRLLGFARESLSASIFGDTSPVNDAFVTAWRVPNLFRAMMGEGAISTSLQTAITRADAEEGEASGRRLFWAIVRVVTWILLGLCAAMMLVIWLLPDRMPITGAAWLGDDPAIVRELTLRMMPFVVLVCLSAVASGALNVRGHFLGPSLAPVIMNAGWIAALFLVAREYGWSRAGGAGEGLEYTRQMDVARWLAWYVLIAGLILVSVQIPALASRGFLGTTHVATGAVDSRVAARRAVEVLKSSVPLALGAAVYQVNVMVDGVMAIGLLPDGGPSLLYYATRVQQFPMSLVSIAATNAVFPALTALGHRRDLHELRALHDKTHLAIAFVAIPASLGLLVFADPVIAVCFQHGAFGAPGVERAALGLRALTLAILPAGAAGLVARTYYALGDFRTPVKISAVMLAANVGLNFLFVRGFGMDIEGLALATALTAWSNLFLLLPGLRSRLGLPASDTRLLARLGRITGAALASVAIARLIYGFLCSSVQPLILLSLSILVAMIAFAALAHLLGIPEWQQATVRLRRIFTLDAG